MKFKIFVLFMVVMSSIAMADCFYHDGRNSSCGTKDNPYVMVYAQDLQNLAYYVDDWSKHFRLFRDIDLADGFLGDSLGFKPIGNSYIRFTGNFDGDGYSIKNLNINRADSSNIGLFGYVNGEIKNLNLENAKIIGQDYVGGIVGNNNGLLTNVKVINSEITGINYVGGITGSSNKKLETIEGMNIKVEGYTNVGGIVGYISNDTIINAFVSGEVTGGGRIGGIVGYTNESVVLSSVSNANVSGTSMIGGIIGSSISSQIINCMSKGAVYGGSSVGGITGAALESDLKSSYSTGVLMGKSSVNGFFGKEYIVSFENINMISNSYYDSETSLSLNPTISSNLTEFSSKSGPISTVDFTNLNKIALDYSDSTWIFNDQARPYLVNQKVSVNNGTVVKEEDDYVLENVNIKIIDSLNLVIAEKGIQYCKFDSLAINLAWISIPLDTTLADKPYRLKNNILDLGTTYFVRAYAKIDDETIYYGDVTGLIKPPSYAYTSVINQTIPEDSFLVVSLAMTDAVGESLTFSLGKTANANNYTIKGDTIIPDTNFFGNLELNIAVNQGTDTSYINTMLITVEPVNDTPTITYIKDDKVMSEIDTLEIIVGEDVQVNDVDGDTIFTLIILDGDNYSFNPGSDVVIPNEDFVGELNVRFQVAASSQIGDTSAVDSIKIKVSKYIDAIKLSKSTIQSNVYYSNNTLNVVLNKTEYFEVMVYTVKGDLVFQNNVFSSRFNNYLTLSSGVYLVKLQFENYLVNKKIVVE